MASRLSNVFVKAAISPALLVFLAVCDPLILRFTLFTALAIPLQPFIWKAGWVYHDKPILLTYQASVFAACVWGVGLYVVVLIWLLVLRGIRMHWRSPAKAQAAKESD
jgi:hypothetical protein